jgi:type IV secretory pathway VirB10-like protein
MDVLRFLLLLIFAVFLASCAAIAPLAQENVSTPRAQTERIHIAEVKPEAKTPTPKPPAPKPKPVATTSDKGSMYPTTPNVGSPEWEKEQADDKRKEEHLKKLIEGICHGC